MAKTTLTPSEVANQAGKEFPIEVDGFQATAATGIVAGFLATRRTLVRSMQMSSGASGTANSTAAKLQKKGTNGSLTDIAGASVSIDNADADGTRVTAGPDAETILEPGEGCVITVTAAATGGTNFSYKFVGVEVFD